MEINKLLEPYTPEQIESLSGKYSEIDPNYIIEKSFLDVYFICSTDLDEIGKKYDQKIKNSWFFGKKYFQSQKDSAEGTYFSVIKAIKISLDKGGLEKYVTLNLLKKVKEETPEKIPKDILEKMEICDFFDCL